MNSLSDKELKLMDVHDSSTKYEDSPFVVYRKVAKIGGSPAAFIEVSQYPDNLEDNSCNIAVATDPEYRGLGLAKQLIQEFTRSFGKNFDSIWYDFNSNNKESRNLIQSIPGFEYETTQDDVEWYKYKV